MMTVMGQVCMQQVKSLETDLKDGLGVDVMAFASRLGHGDAGFVSLLAASPRFEADYS